MALETLFAVVCIALLAICGIGLWMYNNTFLFSYMDDRSKRYNKPAIDKHTER